MPQKKRHLETLGHWDCPWAAVRTPVIRKDLYDQDLCPRHLTNSGKRGAGANLTAHTSSCPTATKTQPERTAQPTRCAHNSPKHNIPR